MIGDARPRISTLSPIGESRGELVGEFARERLGVTLLPWQEHVLEVGLVHDGSRWLSRTVAILVARQNGKTVLSVVRALAGMVLFGEERVIAAAQNRDIAIEAWLAALELAEEAELGVHSIRRTNGQEQFWIGRARYKVAANNRRASRGLSGDLVILDELREFREWDGYAALEKTRRARTSSQLWAISTEGDEGSIVLDSLAEQGRLAASTGTATDLAWLEWSAEAGLERTDPRAWCQANPALGVLITPETLESEARHDEPQIFETEVLCRRVATLRPWLPVGLWDAAAVPGATVPDGSSVVFALDAGPELRHASIAVGWRRPDGKTYLETVAGFDAGAGPVLPRAGERLGELLGRWEVGAVFVAARSAAEAAATRVLEELEVPLVSVSSAELLRAVNAFYEAVVARELVHSGDPMSAGHMAGVTSDGVLRRRSTDTDIDAAVALVLAAHGAVHAPARAAVQDWIAF